MSFFIQDMRFGLRILLKNPAFAVTVVGILALGVGANTAIFSVVDAVLLERLPFDDAEGLVVVRGLVDTPQGAQVRPISYPDFLDWRAGAAEIQGLAAFTGISLNLSGDRETEQVVAELVTHDYFSTLQVEPRLGRLFTGLETDEVGAHSVALISDRLWRRRFDADPGIAGRDLWLNGRAFRVIGVMPEAFAGLSMRAQVWLPMAMLAVVRPPSILQARSGRWLLGVARLREGTGIESAQVELDALSAHMASRFRDTNDRRRAGLQGLRESYVGDLQLTLTVLLGSVGAVLLIACANITNLLLARSTTRSSELAVRRALGAGRSRLARQVLTESLALAVCGGLAGLLVGLWAVEGLRALIPAGVLPAYVHFGLNARVFAFTSLLTLGSGVAFGTAPALRAGLRDLSGRLKGAAPGTGGALSSGVQSLLVTGQVALTAALLLCAGLMARSLVAQLEVDPGFKVDSVTAFSVQLPRDRYRPEARLEFLDTVAEALRGRGGIRAFAAGSDAPFRGSTSASFLWRRGDPPDTAARVRFYRHRISVSYLDVLQVPLIAGRDFAPTDDARAPRVALVSQAAAARLWPGAPAVGERIRLNAPDGAEVDIVGVVGDVTYRRLTDDLAGGTDPDLYFPVRQVPTSGLELLVASDRLDVAAAVRDAVRRADPGLAVTNVASMRTVLEAQTAITRLQSWLLASFGAVALVLGAVGIYGLLAYLVARRDREIGIRLAMGATPQTIIARIVARGMGLAVMGTVVGLALGVWLVRGIEALLFQVRRGDPVTLITVILVLLVSALLASYIPARRAARVDPMRILRSE